MRCNDGSPDLPALATEERKPGSVVEKIAAARVVTKAAEKPTLHEDGGGVGFMEGAVGVCVRRLDQEPSFVGRSDRAASGIAGSGALGAIPNSL